jgi:hypothetical protein
MFSALAVRHHHPTESVAALAVMTASIRNSELAALRADIAVAHP